MWPFSRRSPSPPDNQAAHDLMMATMAAERARERHWNTRTIMEDGISPYGAPPFDLVSPFSMLYNGLKLLFPLVPFSLYGQRRYGQSWLFLSESMVDLYRAFGRWLYESNGYCQSALTTLRDFTIKGGFEYHSVPKRYGRSPSKSFLEGIDRYIEDFLTENEFWNIEKELFVTRRRDGDALVELYAQDGSKGYNTPLIKVHDSERIRNPEQNYQDFQGYQPWTFGIKRHDVTKLPVEYHVIDDEEGPSAVGVSRYISGDEAVYLKVNTDRNMARGIGDFFVIFEILDDATKLLKAGRQGEAVRASIAYVRQWAMADQAALRAQQSQATSYNIPFPSAQGSGAASSQMQPVQQIFPGQVIDLQQGTEFQNGPGYSGSAANTELMLNATLKAAAVRWRMPPWMLTGDIDANFAGALVMDSPLVKNIESDQDYHKRKYTELVRKAVAIGIEQGTLPERTLEMCDISCECPPVAARDPEKETKISETLVKNKVMSRRTWAVREDLDFETEIENIKEEAELLPATLGEEPPEITGDINRPIPDKSKLDESTSPSAQYQREAKRPNG